VPQPDVLDGELHQVGTYFIDHAVEHPQSLHLWHALGAARDRDILANQRMEVRLSNSAQIIVDIEVSSEEAPELARSVRAWLINGGIIQPEQTDSAP